MAAAAVAGLVAKQAVVPTEAANPPLLLDQFNEITDTTSLRLASGTTVTENHMFFVSSDGGRDTAFNAAIHGTGRSTFNAGIFGVSSTPSSNGVVGFGLGTTSGVGVLGRGTTIGVSGSLILPSEGLGSPTASNTVAVQGINNATGTGGIGVKGSTTGTGRNMIAVLGDNQSTGFGAVGVFGAATNGTGVVGTTSASNQYGVLGQAFATNSTAIAGTCTANGSSAFSGGTTNPDAYAGVFQGNVVIQGRLVVSDPSYKSGALLHPDGSHRLVYCVESPNRGSRTSVPTH